MVKWPKILVLALLYGGPTLTRSPGASGGDLAGLPGYRAQRRG